MARGADLGMENRLACLCVRPDDTSDYNHWGYLDSCVRTAGWDSGSPATNPLHDSDFNRYGSVLVCNDIAVTSPNCRKQAIATQNPADRVNERYGDFTTVGLRAYRETSLRTPRMIGTIIPVLNRTQKRS